MSSARFRLLITLGLALVCFAPVSGDDEPTAANPNALPESAQDPLGRPETPTPAFWEKAVPPDRIINPADPFRFDPFSSVSEPVQDRGHEEIELDPGPAGPLRIRQLTFRVPRDKVRALEGDGQRSGNEALHSTLDDLVQNGDVDIIADFDFRAVGGRIAAQEATQEFMYPTEFEPDGELGIVSPTAFDTRNLGTVCSLSPRIRDRGVMAEVSVQRVRWVGFSAWVAARSNETTDPSRRCLVRQPVILSEHLRGSIMLKGARTRLIGVQPEAQAPGTAVDASEAWLYTFLGAEESRPAGAGAESAPAAEADDVALEMVAIPVVQGEAAQWLAKRGAQSDDAADLDEWQRRAAADPEERVPILRRLLTATGPVRPGGPPKTRISSLVEFIHPSVWEPGLKGDKFSCPTAFDTRNCGSEFEVQATWAANKRAALASASVEDVTLEEMEEWPCSLKQQATLNLEQPLFRVRDLKSEVAVPVNGVRFVGVRNSRVPSGRGQESNRECELLFLRAGGTPNVVAPNARPSPPVIEAQAVVFSVSPSMATQLSHESDEARRGAAFWDGALRDQARIIGVFAGTVCPGGTLKTSDLFETISPSEIGAVADDFVLTAFDTRTHGTAFTVQPGIGGGALHCSIRLQWESAPRSRPTIQAFRKFALERQGEFPKPKFFQEEVTAGAAAVPVDGAWHILSFKECSAPEGADEHGRWHAALVRVLQLVP